MKPHDKLRVALIGTSTLPANDLRFLILVRHESREFKMIYVREPYSYRFSFLRQYDGVFIVDVEKYTYCTVKCSRLESGVFPLSMQVYYLASFDIHLLGTSLHC